MRAVSKNHPELVQNDIPIIPIVGYSIKSH